MKTIILTYMFCALIGAALAFAIMGSIWITIAAFIFAIITGVLAQAE